MLYIGVISYDEASDAIVLSVFIQNSVNMSSKLFSDGAGETQITEIGGLKKEQCVKKRYPIIMAQKQEDSIDLRSVFVSPLYPLLKQALLFSLKRSLLKLP